MNTPRLQVSLLLIPLLLAAPGTGFASRNAEQRVATEMGPDLSLTTALELATRSSPRLAFAEAAALRSTALRLQAGKSPNPELEIEFANLDSAEDGDWLDGAEGVYRISQTLELGGKRGHRSALAALEEKLAHLDFDEARAVVENALPAAERAQGVAGEGYRQGKFGLLELLDARHTLLSVQEQQIEILTEYHDTVNELERLIGSALGAVDPGAAEQQGD